MATATTPTLSRRLSPLARAENAGTPPSLPKPLPVKKSTAAIDDPVRLYLLQMGGIPLLTRETEVASARKIERWRRRFRRTLLGNELVLAGAVRMLEKVRDGGLRLDRTIEVSVTNTAEKKRLLKRLGPNLETLRRLDAEMNSQTELCSVQNVDDKGDAQAMW